VPTKARTRSLLLFGAILCLLVVVGLSVMVKRDLQPLDTFDTSLGRSPEEWTFSHPWTVNVLVAIENIFEVLPMALYTLVAAVLLWLRRHQRAAVWTVGVMVGASLSTYLLKRFFQRDRPVWEDPVHKLSSFSFPSGHASGIVAAMGVVVVLSLILVRRRGWRRTLIGLAVFLVLLVGLDRILLGVHNLSDVIAGYCVGGFWVLGGRLVLDPAQRRRPPDPFSSSVPDVKRLAVVLNPVKVQDVGAFKAMVDAMVAEAGWGEAEWHETTLEDPGRAMAEAAAIAGVGMVLVCGGDGTVRTVCAELAGTGIPVGVVPTGTGNLLARNLGIPLYLQAAVEVALHGQDRAIDLVAVSGDGIPADEHFMVMAGMGFDAAIMEGANEQIKARVGWLAYVVSGARNIMFPVLRLEISLDDGPFRVHRARTVVVGNVGYLQAGIPLLPDAAIDDGVLDLVLVAPRRFVGWLPVAVRVLSRNKRTDASLDRMTGRKVSIRAAHDTPRQVDGDSVGAGRELHAQCIHGRLLVRVPR
jgi:YegS/Rv2252/BmrU family lipid kinase